MNDERGSKYSSSFSVSRSSFSFHPVHPCLNLLNPASPTSRHQSVSHQHGNGQKPYAAGNGRPLSGARVCLRRMHVANNRAAALRYNLQTLLRFLAEEVACRLLISHLVDANVNHGCARLDVLTSNEARAPDGGNQDVRLAGD